MGKRILMGRASNSTLCDIFIFCPICGSELLGSHVDLKEYNTAAASMLNLDYSAAPSSLKYELECPICKTRINEIWWNRGCSLDISINNLAYKIELAVKERPNPNVKLFDFSRGKGYLNKEYYGGFSYYYDGADSSINIHHCNDILSLPIERRDLTVQLLPAKPSDEQKISQIFNCLQQVRIKGKEGDIEQLLENIVTESEAQEIEPQIIDIKQIKANPEALKQYLEHLINLESSIYSIKKRLKDLYKLDYSVGEEVTASSFAAAEPKRDELAKAKEASKSIPGKEAFASQKPKAPEEPAEPKEPTRPELKKAGLLNKRRIQEENEALQNEYDAKYQEYKKRYAEYMIEYEEYMKARAEYKKSWKTLKRM